MPSKLIDSYPNPNIGVSILNLLGSDNETNEKTYSAALIVKVTVNARSRFLVILKQALNSTKRLLRRIEIVSVIGFGVGFKMIVKMGVGCVLRESIRHKVSTKYKAIPSIIFD